MSYYDFGRSRALEMQDEPFYAMLMATMRKADDDNTVLFIKAWPQVWLELYRRYNGPGGCLDWTEWQQIHGKELEEADPAQMAELERELSEQFALIEEKATRAMRTLISTFTEVS